MVLPMQRAGWNGLIVNNTVKRDEPRVFLSHTSTDKVFVRRLAGDLKAHNVGVWLDEWEMRVGDSIVERVQQGIDESVYLAVVLSPR